MQAPDLAHKASLSCPIASFSFPGEISLSFETVVVQDLPVKRYKKSAAFKKHVASFVSPFCHHQRLRGLKYQ